MPMVCAQCGDRIRLTALVALCELCCRPCCPDCLLHIPDAHPSGLKPGVYCLTCVGQDRDPREETQ